MNPRNTCSLLKITAATLGAVTLLAGCATKPNPAAPTPTGAATGGTAARQDKDLQKVWLAEGFNFTGYDTLYIAATGFKAVERDNETKLRTLAIGLVQQDLATAMRHSGLFASVVLRPEEIRPNSRVLTMENTIIEYEKGGGGARYWAGLYGAGQPVIKVRGQLTAGGQSLFQYEARRSGESGGARMMGGYLSDERIQREDIHDLALDVAGFMLRTAGRKP